MDYLSIGMSIVNIGLISALIYLIIAFSKKLRIMADDLPTELMDFAVKTVQDNPEAIDSYINNIGLRLKNSIIGSKGGEVTGINTQLRKLGKDLMIEGINESTGLPIGGIASDLLEQYPVLQQFLPLIMSKLGKGAEQTTNTGKNPYSSG